MKSDDLLKLIHERQQEIQSDIQDIKVDIAKNTVDLEHHIKRTELNEVAIEILKERIVPIEAVHYGWKGVGKTITLIASVAAIVVAIIKVMHLF